MTTLSATRRRDLAWLTAVLLVVAGVWVARGDVARAGDPGPMGVDIVYVTVGTNFPDALGIGPGAAPFGAPVILVPTNPPLPGVTAVELTRLDPKKVVIVGGTAAVSTAMEDAIADLLNIQTQFERLSGTNRYATNSEFSSSVYPMVRSVGLDASSFTSDNPDDVVMDGSGGTFYGQGGADLYAPVVLPDGAEILSFTVIGHDSDPDLGGFNSGDDVYVQFSRVTRGNIQGFACGETTNGTPGDFSVTCDFSPPMRVDNANWSYVVRVGGADGDPYIRLLTIEYRLGVPTPDPPNTDGP